MKTIGRFFAALFAGGAVLMIGGCGGGGRPVPGPTQGTRQVSFRQDVQPIFNRSCAAARCHGSEDAQAGLILSADVSYGQLVNIRSTQNRDYIRVIPGNAANSLLYRKLAEDRPPVGVKMPPGGSLSDSEIALIRDWINQGALNN
ncbi:MAG: hypothetical protein NZ959_07960 [Armatimonadetes bacterium]|nr:hypothetical protein [Armatimonadota bacterium]MDW8122902.1 hypothetical protein [Armatimonadota bacterium]